MICKICDRKIDDNPTVIDAHHNGEDMKFTINSNPKLCKSCVVQKLQSTFEQMVGDEQ